MSPDPWNDPGTQKWIGHVRKTLVPMLDSVPITVSLAPPSGSHDIKYAVELGLSILMDKPILLVVDMGRGPVPNKLRMIADDIVYVDWADQAATNKAIMEALEGFQERYDERKTL